MTDRLRPENTAQMRSGDAARLERLLAEAGGALWWEQLWRVLGPALALIALFLGASWLGLWLHVGIALRIVGVLAFVAALGWLLYPLTQLASPSRESRLARVDRDGGVAHRPATASDDVLAMGREDSDTRALWDLHRRRASAALAAVRTSAPEPALRRRDPMALRIAALLVAVSGLVVAGSDWSNRLTSAFAWSAPPLPPAAARIDGWVDPPGYTRIPPVILDLANAEGKRELRVPSGSVVVIRATGASDITFDAASGLTLIPPEGADEKAGKDAAVKPAELKPAAVARPATPATIEQRWKVGETITTLSIKRGFGTLAKLTFTPIPDRPPSAEFTEPAQRTARGSLTLAYKFDDDYGIAAAESVIEPVPHPSLRDRKPRSLVPPPQIVIAMPSTPGGIGEGKTTAELGEHAWGGARVRIKLLVRDDAGQEATTAPAEVVLPQRPFTKPLARALVEQRRNLVMDVERRGLVQEALYAMMIAPERFTPQPSMFLGLKNISNRLVTAKTDEDLIEVADLLWEMAIRLEDGDLSQTERDLRAAQEALRQALENGASEEELKRLMQELRAALDQHLQALAEQMRRENREQAELQPRDPSQRTMRPEDFRNMLDRLEQMTREGARDEAKRLLDELQNLTDNMRTARPRRQQDPMAREFNKALEDLDKMIRDQQALRDETFKEGQQNRNRMNRNRPGQQPGQQQGQRQPGQRGQQGQQGEDGEEGEEPGEGQEGQRGRPRMGQGQQGEGQQLAERQRQLRQKLEELKRKMKGLGAQGEQGFDDADEAMGQAEGSLGQGQNGDAVDAQGRALESLRRGAQGLAQQMQRQMGQGEGEGFADGDPNEDPDGRADPTGQRGRNADRDDPLGRPQRTRGLEDNRGRVPKLGETPSQRAQRVMEELRKRLGDPNRAQEEIDYLRRLLSPY